MKGCLQTATDDTIDLTASKIPLKNRTTVFIQTGPIDSPKAFYLYGVNQLFILKSALYEKVVCITLHITGSSRFFRQ